MTFKQPNGYRGAKKVETGELDGRVALITGAARKGGLGRAFALELGRLGAAVVISDVPGASEDLTEEERAAGWRGLLSLAEELKALGRRTLVLDMDVTDSGSVDAGVAALIAEFGRLDILINNAGFSRTGRALHEIPESEWLEVIDVSLNGTYRCCRAAIPHLISAGRGGRIISIASSASRRPMARYGSYPAAKAGVAAMMRTIALELAPYGITANAISPGPVATDRIPYVIRRMAELGGISEAEAEANYLETIPLGRPGRTDEIAALVGFLAGSRGAWITGQEIFPNGGWVMP